MDQEEIVILINSADRHHFIVPYYINRFLIQPIGRAHRIINVNYNNGNFKETEGSCIICLEEGTLIYNCHETHTYHKECLDKWVNESRSLDCCVCKKSLN